TSISIRHSFFGFQENAEYPGFLLRSRGHFFEFSGSSIFSAIIRFFQVLWYQGISLHSGYKLGDINRYHQMRTVDVPPASLWKK
ncbi:MAG: hypothetical protein VXA56_16830, partial [Deltaproteobacteria bacterium]